MDCNVGYFNDGQFILSEGELDDSFNITLGGLFECPGKTLMDLSCANPIQEKGRERRLFDQAGKFGQQAVYSADRECEYGEGRRYQ